jgi:hypothetical protein
VPCGKKISLQVCALNICVAWKNVGVQECALNLSLCGVHTHNNDARGVCSFGRAQMIFVGVCVMWVYVVVRQFS